MNRIVAKAKDLPPGSRKIVSLGGQRSIGIFNINGRFYAVKNLCPHQGGPLCQGRIKPHANSSGPYHVIWERENETLRCPWHNWEFDLKTGRALYDSQLRVKVYQVTVVNDDVVIQLS